MHPFSDFERLLTDGVLRSVNKEQSKKFEALVNAAPEFIKDLPWGKDYEGQSALTVIHIARKLTPVSLARS